MHVLVVSLESETKRESQPFPKEPVQLWDNMGKPWGFPCVLSHTPAMEHVLEGKCFQN